MSTVSKQRLMPRSVGPEPVTGPRKLKLIVEYKEESASRFSDYLLQWGSKQFDLIPVTHIAVTDGFQRMTLKKIRSITPREYLWHTEHDGSTTVICPHRWTGKNWELPLNQYCWLAVKEGEDIPIMSYEYRPFPFLKLQRTFATLDEIARERGINTTPFQLSSLPSYTTGNPEINLYHRQTIIADTTVFGISMLYKIYLNERDQRKPKNVLIEPSLVDRMENLITIINVLRHRLGQAEYSATHLDGEVKALTEKHGRCKEWTKNFLAEAIARLEKTKSASRHRVFGEFRKFLEEKLSELQQVFS